MSRKSVYAAGRKGISLSIHERNENRERIKESNEKGVQYTAPVPSEAVRTYNANLSHTKQFAAKPQPRKLDDNVLSSAFGKWNNEKLCNALRGAHDNHRQQAVSAVASQCSDRLKLYSLLKSEVPNALLHVALTDQRPAVRRGALLCLQSFTESLSFQSSLQLKPSIILLEDAEDAILGIALKDPDVSVRNSAWGVLENLAARVRVSMIQDVLEYVRNNALATAAVRVLWKMQCVARDVSEEMPITFATSTTELLQSRMDGLRMGCDLSKVEEVMVICRTIGVITRHSQHCRIAIGASTLLVLADALHIVSTNCDHKSEVVEDCLQAIFEAMMHISVDVEGKKQFVGYPANQDMSILKLMVDCPYHTESRDSATKVALLQLLLHLSEHVAARRYLSSIGAEEFRSKYTMETDELVRGRLGQLVQSIEWTP